GSSLSTTRVSRTANQRIIRSRTLASASSRVAKRSALPHHLPDASAMTSGLKLMGVNSFRSGMLQRLGPTDPQIGRAKVSGCCGLVGDHPSHRPVITERPRLAWSYVAGSGGLFDDTPGAVGREADDGLTSFGTRTTRLTGRVGVACRAYRDAPPCRCVFRQGR